MPDVWRSKSSIVIGRLSGSVAGETFPSSLRFSATTFTSEKAGIYFARGSARINLPSSTSIIAATDVTGFDIE